VGAMDLGLHLTGASNIKQEAYADDDTYDLSGLTLEADYVNDYGISEYFNLKTGEWDTTLDPRTTQIVRKPIKLRDTSWEIKPRYDQVKFAKDGYYDGYLYVTVGRFNDFETIMGGMKLPTYPSYNAGGITVMVPLDKVWTVKDINAITLKDANDISTYYFWEENTKDAWITRLGDKAYLDVTYTDGGAPKQKYIKDLADKARIYWNADPDEGELPKWWNHVYVEGELDFDIMTIRYPLTKKSTDLGVVIYYRGAQYSVPVDVFTTLKSVNVTPAVRFWPDPNWDNDVDNGVGGPAHLASQIDVTATYQAINSGKTSDVTLHYWDPSIYPDEVEWFSPASGYGYASSYHWGRPYGAGPYYLFDTNSENIPGDDDFDSKYFMAGYDDDGNEIWEMREAGDTYDGTSTYVKGYQKYLTNLNKGKHETTTNVTVRHWMNVDVITTFYYYLFWGRHLVERTSYNSNNHFYSPVIGSGYWFPWPNADDFPVDYASLEGGFGMLPNGFNWYNIAATKAPFLPKGTLGRNFGPKVSQTKKNKVAVTWTDQL